MPSISILIADDSSAWRVQARKILRQRPDWHIACEACDGEQAVQHAVELRPDIILLDIGMPVLNGIAAAKQIRRAFPNSKIVFLTQNTDFEMMEETRAVGAVGYVVKAHALSELLPTIEAALRDGHRTTARLNEPVV
jgi:DNA-binding NarL/FixJ family response regulator